MSLPLDDLVGILIHRNTITTEQAAEAREVVRRTGTPLLDVLVRLGYATPAQVMQATAELFGLAFVDVTEVTVSSGVIELVPESVARENVCLPLAQGKGGITIAMCDPTDLDLVQKLAFILNREIHVVLAVREQIVEAINLYYGLSETESVDSLLQEFTDTAIDFGRSPDGGSGVSLGMGEESAGESDSEFELTLDDSNGLAPLEGEESSEERDTFETDFEVPALDEESGSRAVKLDDADTDLESSDFDLDAMIVREGHGASQAMACEEEEDQAIARPRRKGKSGLLLKGMGSPTAERQATVRYYHRMNPQRMFPLLVVISKKTIAEIVKRGVSQARGGPFRAAVDVPVEVEPILPGCQCYPRKEHVSIRQEQVSATFWVVPQVLGRVRQARIVLRQDGKVLTEVPLEVKVGKHGVTLLLGALSFVLPFVLMMLRHYGLDFQSQLSDGFSVYAGLLQWCLESLRPEVLGGALLALTAIAFLWLRPRQRDVFWDIQPAAGTEVKEKPAPPEPAEEGTPAVTFSEVVEACQAQLFGHGDRLLAQRQYAPALRSYESGLALGSAKPIVYHRAALTANKIGNNRRALAILQKAAGELAPAAMPGVLWYNMGCFTTRLGRFDEAMGYLNRAVAAGYDRPDRYDRDPDLSPLRWRPDFKALLRSLAPDASAKRR